MELKTFFFYYFNDRYSIKLVLKTFAFIYKVWYDKKKELVYTPNLKNKFWLQDTILYKDVHQVSREASMSLREAILK